MRNWPYLSVIIIALLPLLLLTGCFDEESDNSSNTSVSGVKQIDAAALKDVVNIDSKGMTVEQRNYFKRLKRDMDHGSLKYLYIVNSQGKCIFQTSVDGKVSSGGKRVNPTSVAAGTRGRGQGGKWYKEGVEFDIGGNTYRTSEVMDEFGTFGKSNPYYYFFNMRDAYFQVLPLGGGLFGIVSDVPIDFEGVTIDLDVLTRAAKQVRMPEQTEAPADNSEQTDNK